MKPSKKGIITLILLLICIVAFAQDTASPRSGDGIHSLLRRHHRTKTEHYQQFIDLNKSKLGKNNSLILGVKYQLPPLSSSPATTTAAKRKGTNRKEPLFGKKYENYTVESNELNGACYFLVCGHGGPDCGAIGKLDGRELHEDEYAYDIVLRLARVLLSKGATVHIIIQDKHDGIRDDKFLKNSKTETCMGEPIPLNQVQRLKQRCNKINSISKKSPEKYQRAISIHLDSRNKSHQTDVYFYHSTNNNKSKQFATTLRNKFEEQYKKHQPNRGFKGTVSARNLYVLNNTTPISAFAELGNIQNSFDQRRFVSHDNRQALANWLCRGFIEDYENFKKKK